MAEAREWAERILEMSPTALWPVPEGVVQPGHWSTGRTGCSRWRRAKMEALAVQMFYNTDEAEEGVRAFNEKRPPRRTSARTVSRPGEHDRHPRPAIEDRLVLRFWAARLSTVLAVGVPRIRCAPVPAMVGTALAVGVGRAATVAATVDALNWLLFALALTGSVAIQIGTNLTDEYSDHRKSGSEGKFLAPHKVIQRGLLSERAVALGMGTAFGYGVVAGLIIVAHVGWPILVVGLASVAAAYLYAGGPKPLGTLGLGEPVVFVFMGQVMVMAAYYVQQEALTWASFYVSLPVAFIVTASSL